MNIDPSTREHSRTTGETTSKKKQGVTPKGNECL